ncbi:hypothetical protein [Chitinophaga nivalis]|uniref:YD repeat-containing protein n=1 Tax=Chitinophaga nivalis TaxID=2991709 RepID=A0ABT3IF33_9BACT|nr:hypothetical protein [Chitinophaga nivalis]MCW3467736.1 hypothetical protein [Chitinophaga nivalis]MCW3482572.1 hypothetical protein [Chitinophaga nivalis]
MKQITLFLLAIVLVSCSKQDASRQLQPSLAGTRILKLVGPSYLSSPGLDSAVITYNSLGNPTRVKRGYTGTGSPGYELRYNAQNRLTDIIWEYNGGESIGSYFESWHRLSYDPQGRIVLDSTYSFGVIGAHGPLPRPDQTEVTLGNIFRYTYDGSNRIIKMAMGLSPTAPYYTIDWYYNSLGNAYKITYTSYPFKNNAGTPNVTDTYPTYDTKTNARRLHPFWQFIDRDYSKNNPFTASSYNIYSLPNDVPGIVSNPNGLIYMGLNSFNNLVIKYN